MNALRGVPTALARTVCALAFILAACGGDTILGPPDGPACTQGSIAPGDSVTGAITESSCLVFSETDYSLVRAESWTLQAKKNTAYVVRLNHVADKNGVDNLRSGLFAYIRNAQGDPVLATTAIGSFATANANGGVNREMFLVTDVDRAISIRVHAYQPDDTGSYTLVIESCPVRPLTSGVEVADVDLAKGCLSRTMVPGKLYRDALFTFPADLPANYSISGARTAGNGTIKPMLSGSGMDINCLLNSGTCTDFGIAAGVNSFSGLSPMIERPGVHTLRVGVNADSSATISVSYTRTQTPAPPAQAPGRRDP